MRPRALAAFGLPLLSALATLLAPGRPVGDGAELVALEAFPPAIVLHGPWAEAQVVLTGVRRDGMRVDLTRAASADPCALVAAGATGRVRATADGEGTLRFLHGELAVTVPVRVSDTGTAPTPSFVTDVMPILSRSGCNAGTCHGAAQGKNGFKLSLRGYDPAADHQALTDDLAGRRFDRAAPDQSLFLQKPLGTVPHEGGQKLVPGGTDHAILRRWVEDGVRLDLEAPRVTRIELFPADPVVPEPGMSQQFAVLAHYQDGRVRDVTALAFLESGNLEVAVVDGQALVRTLRRGDAPVLARFEGHYAAAPLFVMGDRTGWEWQPAPQHNRIDELVDQDLRRIRSQPGELCTDEEFVRRVHLDLTGLPPSRDATVAFLLDRREQRRKRDELIDRLIGSPEFVEHWTNRWCDLLQVNRKYLGEDGARALRTWIQGAVASNLPHDRFVHELLTATGSTLQQPAAAFWKVQRAPDLAMESVTQLFLGIRFNCNKCHDHPFERWTQRQHWQLAGYLAQVTRTDAPGSPKMPPGTAMAEGEQPPAYEELIADDAALPGIVRDPDGREYQPALPFTHADTPAAAPTRRAHLAGWLTAAANPYFAQNQVNRLWAAFLGRGLIEPVDDVRAGNPPTNPELLRHLTDTFVDNGFDSRALMREICRSRVYQQSVRGNRWNEDDDGHFSHARPRRLPAETLFDALHLATGTRPKLQGARAGRYASQALDPAVQAPDGFLELFGRPPRESVCECERQDGTSLGQALNLVNGPTLAAVIEAPDNDITALLAHEPSDERVLEELFLAFLSRRPRPDEVAALLPRLDALQPQNSAALPPAAREALEQELAQWEARHPVPQWQPLRLLELRSAGGATLRPRDDGAVLVSGDAPERDTYTLVGSTDLQGLTGLRLEVLPDDALPNRGPGRAENGNFVLSRLRLTALPLTEPTAARAVPFAGASASFAQEGWPVAEALVDNPKGWAIVPRTGRPHEAWFATAEPIGQAGGTLLVVTLEQPYGSRHTLGCFRLAVTTSEGLIRYHGLPEAVAAALAVPAAERNEAQRAAVFGGYLAQNRAMAARIRLAAAQDLCWALATSAQFLFHR